MKKVIVTGANGFVGSALCRELSEHGIEIIAVVRNEEENISSIEKLDKIRIVYCDMAQFLELDKYISDRDIDVFYHFAWVGTAGPLRGNSDVQLNNLKYTCDTVKACHKMNCRKFVFASSIMEYEIEALMKTDATPGINTLYCSAKLATDYIARTIAGDLGIDFVRAVISNIYGPGEISPRLINMSLRKLLNGDHCSFSAGEQLYDFVYITDAAKIFHKLGEQGHANRTYYIGSINPRPLKEFLIEMKDQVNVDIEIGLGEIPFNGISLSYEEFDIMAVKNDTGFVPEVSFAEGIRRTIQWLQEM